MNIFSSMIGMQINYFTALALEIETDEKTKQATKYLNDYLTNKDISIAIVQEIESQNSGLLIKHNFAIEILNNSNLINSYIYFQSNKKNSFDILKIDGKKYYLHRNIYEEHEPIPISNNQINFKPIPNQEKFSCAQIGADVLIEHLGQLPIEMANYIRTYQLHHELENTLPKTTIKNSTIPKKANNKI